jgi:alpha-beta hydrolase superfamily lysophospholipase
MRKHLHAVALFVGVGVAAACSSSTNNTTSSSSSSSSGGAATVTLEVQNPCADAVDAIYADPGALTKAPASRGNILKCAKEASISKDDLQAKLQKQGYKGDPATTGVTVYRVLYQTERGDEASSVGYASAKVLIPDSPVDPKVPAVVVASGTRGQAAKCAASKADPDRQDRALEMLYASAAKGMPTIITDLAGYANYGAPGNPQSAYALSTDAGRSMLDAARALRKLAPKVSDQVALIGHSLGGHTALSALALSETYGADAKVVAVAVHAPFWIPQRSWGTVLNEGIARSLGLTVAASELTAAVAIWYHYGHGEVLDGPGKGLELFAADKRPAIKSLVDNYCLGGADGPSTLGVEYIAQVFDPGLIQSVRQAAPGLSDCEPTDDVCKKWIARYIADRPAMTGAAAKVPILLTYGEKDATIAPNRMRCGTDKLKKDGANMTVCFKKGEDHSSIVDVTSSDVSKWVYAQATGQQAPTLACDGDVAALTAECANPPPND